ncbi:hypothetical protein NT2_13_00800 [Caenibius tardaugens NBRC 16725]|uniref:Uncharacterized protein n=2 Tax=Caenibius TaxID=2827482 RepID=U3A8A7_9SPHN|nr:hypothetical protein NT2_13_00800 [Caenibius tardaugens NBRC 16725]
MTTDPDTSPDNTSPLPMPDEGSATEDAQIAAARDEDIDRFDDSTVVRVRTYDPITVAMAGSFGSFIPGAIATAYASLVWTLELHGDFSISNGGGTLQDYFEELVEGSPEQKKAQEQDDALRDAMDDAQEVREREREEWERTEHSLGGVTMTGAEWSAFSDDLKNDTPLRRWLIAQIKQKENKTDAEAKTEADDIALYAKMQSMPPSQWTGDMTALDRKLSEHPDIKAEYEEYVAGAAKRRDQSLGQSNALETSVSDGSRNSSGETKDDILDDHPFAGTPNLAPQFRSAAAPSIVADATVDPALPKPGAQVAIAAKPALPMTGGTGGFDMS